MPRKRPAPGHAPRTRQLRRSKASLAPVAPAETYPGVLITKAEYERAIHKLIVAKAQAAARIIVEAQMGEGC